MSAKCAAIPDAQVRKDYSPTCNSCSKTESAMANTLFHKVKFGIRKAFFICLEMSTTTKSMSSSYMAVRYGVSENTARLFMHKVREGMKSSGASPMDGTYRWTNLSRGGKQAGQEAMIARRKKWYAPSN